MKEASLVAFTLLTQAVIVALGGNDGLRGIDPRASEANLAAHRAMLAGRQPS